MLPPRLGPWLNLCDNGPMLGHWMWLCTTAFAQSQPADPSSPAGSPVPVSVWLQAESRDSPVVERFVSPLAGAEAVQVDVVVGEVVEHVVQRRASAEAGPRVEVVIGTLLDDRVDCFDGPALEAQVHRLTSIPGSAGVVAHVAVGLVRTPMEPLEDGEADDGESTIAGWDVLRWNHAGCIEVVEAEAPSGPVTLTHAVVGLGFGIADTDELHARLGAVGAALRESGHDLQLVELPVIEQPVRMQGWVRVRDVPVRWSMQPPAAWSGCDDPSVEVALSVGGSPIGGAGAATCDGTVELSLSRLELQRRFLAAAGPDPRIGRLQSRGVITVRSGARVLDDKWASISALNESSRPLPWWGHARDAFSLRPWERRIDVTALDLEGLDRRPFLEALALAAIVGLALFWWITRSMYRARVRRSLRRVWRDGTHASDPLRARPAAVMLEDGRRAAARGGRLGRWLVGLVVATCGAGAVAWSVLRVFEVWGG